MSCIYPVILSGGVGSRLWPLSRSLSPKQSLRLAGEQSLIQQTALRTNGPQFAKPLIICHTTHRFLVAQQMRAVGVEPRDILLEPVGRNTAPAAAVAALAIAERDPGGVLLVMPADHVIGNGEALHAAVDIARGLAKSGHLVTFGIHPTGPETGYGYIQRGAALGPEAFKVARFVEKPAAETAQRYVETGDYYWNSGIFAFRATAYLAELERLEPEILACCRAALRNGRPTPDGFWLAGQPFEACKSTSIDYAVMEHTDKAAIVPAEMGWNDLGSWGALWDMSDKNSDGNALMGDVLHHNTHNSYLRSEGPLLAAFGVNDLIVVASPDAVLVGPKSASQDVKKIVEQLEHAGRDLHISHREIHHSWGRSERISQNENFEVNRLTLDAGSALSLPAGHRWRGHWIVVSGIARAINGEGQVSQLRENGVCALSGTGHHLENLGEMPLCVIEVRIGTDLKAQ